MLSRLLLNFAGVDVKRVTIITLSIGVCLLYAYVHEQNVQLATAKLVYSNPQRSTKTKKSKETGAVRIVTRYIDRPTGERETIIDETRGPVIETETVSDETKPVPIAIALAQPRTDRYLVSAGMNRLTPDFDGKAFFVGYGFKNRLDIQVGGVQHDGFSPWVLTTLRF